MNEQARPWATVAAIGGALGVVMGAFAAHGIEGPEEANWLRTGGYYMLVHALAALVALQTGGDKTNLCAARLFIVGSILFAGTLAIMAFGGPHWLGSITPIGGLALVAGWFALAWSFLRQG